MTDCGVCTSPYTSPPSTLRFGPDRQSYYVPKVLLQSLGELPDDPWERATSLPDVDADTGHVIVHFLHTGTYQTLVEESEDFTTSLSASKEFLKAALVCVAAKKYKLTDLEELASKEMKQCGTDVSITELVQLISEDTFRVLCSECSWLQEFVTDKVEVAIKSGDDEFLTTGLFASIVSSSLARLLAQEVVNIYHKENMELRSKTAAPNGHSFTLTASPDAKEALEAELRPPVEDGVIPGPRPEPVSENVVSDHDSDYWGFDLKPSKKKKKMRKPPPSEPDEIIETLPEPVSEPVREVGSAPEQEPEIEATPDFEPLLEKSAPVPEVVHAEPVCDPFAGLSKSQKKKLEKKMKEENRLSEAENARVASALEEAVHDHDAPEPPLPSGPLEADPESVSNHFPLTESTPVVLGDQMWSEFGPSKKKTKKKGAMCLVKTPAEEEAALGSDLIEEALLVHYTEVPDPTVELAVVRDAEECPWRVEHLSESDGWRTCVPCELYVRKIASKLYPTGYSDATEVGTIK